MIIDCHGHYTTAPASHDGQKAAFKAGGDVDPAYPDISDDEIRETIEQNQLRLLFGSEMVGAVRGIDPETGNYFDDTKRYVDALAISAQDKAKVFSGNARRVYPRLDASLKARGL